MHLSDYGDLQAHLTKLVEDFPREHVWRELLEAVESHWSQLTLRETILPPREPKKWNEWCRNDTPSILYGECIDGSIFYPKKVELPAGSSTRGAIFATGAVQAERYAEVKTDVVSLEKIFWQGRRVRTLIAPEIWLDQTTHRLEALGSILCRHLFTRPSQTLSGRVDGILCIVGESLNPQTPPDVELRLEDGTACGELRTPSAVDTGLGVKLRSLSAAGSVGLGPGGTVGNLRGRDVTIGREGRVRAVRADGHLVVAEDSWIEAAIAEGDVSLARNVTVAGSFLASREGHIEAEQGCWAADPELRYRADVARLEAKGSEPKGEPRLDGTVALRWLPHRIFTDLRRRWPDWCRELEPIQNG